MATTYHLSFPALKAGGTGLIQGLTVVAVEVTSGTETTLTELDAPHKGIYEAWVPQGTYAIYVDGVLYRPWSDADGVDWPIGGVGGGGGGSEDATAYENCDPQSPDGSTLHFPTTAAFHEGTLRVIWNPLELPNADEISGAAPAFREDAAVDGEADGYTLVLPAGMDAPRADEILYCRYFKTAGDAPDNWAFHQVPLETPDGVETEFTFAIDIDPTAVELVNQGLQVPWAGRYPTAIRRFSVQAGNRVIETSWAPVGTLWLHHKRPAA